MKFEKLNYGKEKNKRMFLYGFIVCAIFLVLLNIIISKAMYRKTESVQLATGTVNYSVADFNLLSVNLQKTDKNGKALNEYETLNVDEIPKKGYILNTEKTYCTAGVTNKKVYGQGSTNLIEITYRNGLLSFDNVDLKNTKCYIYLDKGKQAIDVLETFGLKSNGTIESFIGTACDNGTNNYYHNSENCGMSTQNKGIFEAEDDYGTSYYFRGTIDNNWVKIGSTYWRIIRINGNGTIRLIYSGTQLPEDGRWIIGENSNIAINQKYNSSNDNKYVGFMYGGEKGEASTDYIEAHKNTTNSDILNKLINWYDSSELRAVYEDIIDGETGFCNDRTKSISEHGEGYTNEGYGKNPTYYGPGERTTETNSLNWNKNIQTPTLKCINKERDLFTMNGKEGNQSLTIPLGLITVDEVIFAGGFAGQDNYGYWLYTQQNYWTMSPCNMRKDNGYATVFIVDYFGKIPNSYVSNGQGLRPVVNIKADTLFEPSNGQAEWGTTTNPFVVKIS